MLATRLLVIGLALTLRGPNRPADARTASSTSDGVYTAAQAQRGDALYARLCASCHGSVLEGSSRIPSLSGDEFTGYWVGRTMADLFDKVQTTMPADHPGKLAREQTAEVLAFILRSNRYPSGKAELPADTDSLKKIRIGRIHRKR